MCSRLITPFTPYHTIHSILAEKLETILDFYSAARLVMWMILKFHLKDLVTKLKTVCDILK